eukprot:NODE_810_length_1171_cov_191.190731_g572_i0.p1 GENE.NODE_810_length_1171_cov_191.190731_g572_i0~~NODE_810_length_1171_cov_191.190731_g572_i0.p1  ORF type:complete len:198 (-),score=39.96 NODE_810_length_1171_cov_191.190731_g572_i0:279-872(-)
MEHTASKRGGQALLVQVRETTLVAEVWATFGFTGQLVGLDARSRLARPTAPAAGPTGSLAGLSAAAGLQAEPQLAHLASGHQLAWRERVPGHALAVPHGGWLGRRAHRRCRRWRGVVDAGHGVADGGGHLPQLRAHVAEQQRLAVGVLPARGAYRATRLADRAALCCGRRVRQALLGDRIGRRGAAMGKGDGGGAGH